MCKWGKTRPLYVEIPGHLSYSGRKRKDIKMIDSCIYDFVKMLNDNGYKTIASCCGHAKQPMTIAFYDKDGKEKELRIMNYEQARKVDKLFPSICKS